MSDDTADVLCEVRGAVGFITLNRPQALNALTLSMIRALTTCLLAWREDDRIQAVAIRGSNKAGPFGAFCAGGDIRFFHQALLSGDPAPEDFFTEEYTLNHLIHSFPKPYIAFMDGVVMGGGMGISQGASHRLVTSRSKLAMPETAIGLFPDVGGGYFLSRCPGYAGEWLALTGTSLGAAEAIELGLADHCLDAGKLAQAWDALADIQSPDAAGLHSWLAEFSVVENVTPVLDRSQIDAFFALDSVSAIVHALEADASDWAQRSALQLRQRSPLMLHVAFEQIRRARQLTVAQDLRMERDMMRHCFFPRHLARSGAQTETAEGIRALVIDKDNAPVWQPARIEAVTPEMVQPFFASPWVAHSHPLRALP
ncbi:enoyl-CoA hydratase/isomerase family protein [Rhodoferax sp.]|uniref:enoyl-CoA hydratase/isomerase family protein n=1 Tax=Rhodoferax sp. TaxID=50421 RepID=UPI0027241F98|nr:enoyl-CoA hydratase/isomerase family protein [Rhodoferax sp.]MDO9145462.1 enoyl-CoA hydratase/isomerase family protein [Rhodoferax sp.]MDP3864937.1 enoyl-CoA hydratase/isomerase family protein [Rhodoferax sp.]